MHLEDVKGDLPKAIAAYETVIERFPARRESRRRRWSVSGPPTQRADGRMTRVRCTAGHPRIPTQIAEVAEATARLASLGKVKSRTQDTGIVARQVWNNRFIEGSPSPDGRYIPWVNWAGTADLMVHDLVTGEDRQLTHAPRGGSHADGRGNLAPDGKQLVYAGTTTRRTSGSYDGSMSTAPTSASSSKTTSTVRPFPLMASLRRACFHRTARGSLAPSHYRPANSHSEDCRLAPASDRELLSGWPLRRLFAQDAAGHRGSRGLCDGCRRVERVAARGGAWR